MSQPKLRCSICSTQWATVMIGSVALCSTHAIEKIRIAKQQAELAKGDGPMANKVRR